jgi:hypothetical protein
MQRTMGGYAVTTSLPLVLGSTSPGAATLAYQSHRADHADRATVESKRTGGRARHGCGRTYVEESLMGRQISRCARW